MYKPPKNNDPVAQQRVKLPLMSSMPSMKQARAQFDECNQKRGTIIEQQWSTGRASQLFNLMVQWDKTAEFPVWTLYEENGVDSKMHWSQPFPPTDIEMLYDILSMTVEAGAQSSAKIPESLKPKDSPFPMAGDKPQAGGGGLGGSFLGNRANSMLSHLADQPGMQPAAAPEPAPPPPPPPPAPAPAYVAPAPAAPAYTPPTPSPNYGAPPQQAPGYPPQAQGYPPQNYPPQAPAYPPQGQPAPPYPPQGYQQPAPTPYPPVAPVNPQAAYPPYGGYPPPQAPPGYPPQYPPQQPGQAPSVWQTQTGQEHPVHNNSTALPPELSPVKGGGRNMDYELSPRGTNILLGTLLFEAGMINKPTLDAALKLQDMVREERITIADAPENLKRLHDMGASIEQYVTKSEGIRKPQPAPTPNRSGPTKEQVSEQRAVFDLLQKSGLLKEEDLKSASAVRNKHGGDMVQILQAAGKLDPTTYGAAATCVPLIRDNKMKVEQCIIAINYCNRSRVDFATALEELNWPNPLK